MIYDESSENGDWEQETKSKSQRKREMQALQDLGLKLIKLNEKQLAQFPLSDDLLQALGEYARIRKNEAKRRQLQYIGKLMRSEDHDGIAAAFDSLAAQARRKVQREHMAESWRDKLLTGDPQDLTDFLDRYPDADRQTLRNLVRNALQEKQRSKPPAQARKLLRLLREIIVAEQPRS